jgi:plasmid stability protein
MSAVATLYVRNVPSELYAQLQHWAEASGRSVNAEVLSLLERESARRDERRDWAERHAALRRKLGLTQEDAEFAVAAIRAHRDAGL